MAPGNAAFPPLGKFDGLAWERFGGGEVGADRDEFEVGEGVVDVFESHASRSADVYEAMNVV